MPEIQDRCVLLKNLPPTCEEQDVRDTLDFAHGNFRFDGKYEKLHRHIEFGNDVRWIVLFRSKKDAIDCIDGGSWESNAVRGGCLVTPDYCSGCIVPDEWSEDTSEEEEKEEEWDMVKSCFPNRDFDVDTSEEFMNSFVNVKSFKSLKHDDTDSGNDDKEQGATNVPNFGVHHEHRKPIPAKRSSITRKSNRCEESGNDTVKIFENHFETLISGLDDDSSDGMFISGNDKEGMDMDKDDLDFYTKKTPKAVSPSESTCLSGERISTSELYGSGNEHPGTKEEDDITIDRAKTKIATSINERSIEVATETDQENNIPREVGSFKGEREKTSREYLSDELFGNGSVPVQQPEIKEKGDVTKDRAKKDIAMSVNERYTEVAREAAQENNVQTKVGSFKCEKGKTSGEQILSDDLFGSGCLQPEDKEKEDTSITMGRPKENIDKPDNERVLVLDNDRDDNMSCQQESFKREKDNKIEISTNDEILSKNLENLVLKLKPKSEQEGKDNDYDGRSSSVSSGDLFHSGDKIENTKKHNSDDIIDSSEFDIKRKQNAFIRSVDMFGSGRESLELKNVKEQEQTEDANGEQVTENKRANTGSEVNKSKTLDEQAVNTSSADSGTGVGLSPPFYQGVPYPHYPAMYPNHQGESNMTYMTMIPQGQNQPNVTSPGIQTGPGYVNAMYQMPYQWPVQMPVQGKDNVQHMYPVMPFPFMMPHMQLDENGRPLQNYPGMMMQPGYSMPYFPGQYPLTASTPPQQSADEKGQPLNEGHSSHDIPNDGLIEEKNEIKPQDVSKSHTHDRINSASDTKENVYDVPKSTPRTLARQISTGKTSCNQENSRAYSYARESKLDVVSDVKTKDNDTEQKYLQLRKSYVEENIYDEIDEDKLKSFNPIKARPPEPPTSNPPTKARATFEKANKKKSRVPVYDDDECKVTWEENDKKESEGIEETCRTILVTGFSKRVSKDTIELYFENRKKTGGGEIVSTTINPKKLEAVIEFKKSKDAATVIQRANNGERFMVADCQLQVSEYRPPPMDPLKVFISRLAESTSSECIENFLAANIGLEPSTVVFGETPGTALIGFETRIDKANLRKVCEARTCEGNHWNISEVEFVRSVKVEGMNARSTTTESISLYFENKRKSKGGPVESTQHRELHGDFIVTFENYEDAARVCTVEHFLNGEKMKVSLFYPCLELDEDFIVRIPPAIQLDSLDEYIIKFLKNSKKYRENLERSLHVHHANLHWQTAPQNFFQIKCTVDPNDKKGYLKVKDWTETCTNIVMEMIEKLAVERSRNVAVEVWNGMKTRLQQIAVSDPESIAVFLESNECAIVMTGEKKTVLTLAEKINNIIDEIEDDFEKRSQIVTKKKKLKHYEMALFRVTRLESTLKKALTDFSIDSEQREVVCQGMQKDVDEALAKLEAKLKSFVKKPVPEMSKEATDLLFMREARDLVKKKMRERKIVGVWDSSRSGLFMYSKNEKDVDTAVEILRDAVKMDSIALDSEKKDILDSKDGKAKVAELEENNKGCIVFANLPNELRFACVNELYKEIKDDFSKLFDLHSLVSQPVQTELGIFEYIVKYNKREVESIENQFKRLAVEIDFKESRRNPGFIVKGKKDGCKLAIARLQSLIDLVVHKDYTVSWPGFDKFLKSSEGKDCIHMIELFQKCIIKVSSEELSSAIESKIRVTPRLGAQGDQPRKIKKEVKIGTLASEKVDVIVNSTNKDLDMALGAISRSLLKAGGDVIRQECKSKYPDELKPGRVAVTTGGSLACEEIFHGLLVKWDGGQGHAENVMQTFIKSCLALAHTKKYSSIAFPALGTGALGFPADVVAKIMFDTVDIFEAKYSDTSVRLVRFVVWSEDRVTAKAFKDVESKIGVSRPRSGLYNYRSSEMAESLIVKNKGYSTTIGSVTVSIAQDDLTTLTSGAIVNSTTDDLNLNSGAISKAILVAAGSVIEREAMAQRDVFLRKGLVVTSPGKLMCRSIIHVRARNTLSTWADTIRKCLIETENLGLNSVAFPALGTGGKGVPPDRMAKTMIETFQDYINSSDFQRCLKTIRIVIFEKNMVDLFTTEVKSIMDPEKASKRKGFFSDLKFWENKPQITEQLPGTTFHIYCGSQYAVDTVIGKVDDIRKEMDVFVKKQVLDHMEEAHKQDLRRIGYTNGVKVVVGKSGIKVLGYGLAADNAVKKVEEYIKSLDRDIKKGYSATAVKLPKIWTKMKLSDPTKFVMLLPGDQDLLFVSQKFQNESGTSSSRIVTIERIQNPTLFTQYIGKKTQMEIHNKGGRKVEQLLWHGTSSSAAISIKNKGFDRNYNSGASHGVGVYFAVNAATSANGYCSPDSFGHKHIFLAHVLTGEYCLGQHGIRVPPPNPGHTSATYDSTTDNVQNPNFFVIFHDAQAYPSYLITFK